MQFYQIAEQVAELVQSITEHCPVVSAALGGLDIRCGQVYVGEDFIAPLTPRQLDYYGGFEYIEGEHIQVLGDLKVYSADSDRVADFLEAYNAR